MARTQLLCASSRTSPLLLEWRTTTFILTLSLAISAPSGDHTMADTASLCANSRTGIGGDASFAAAGLPPPPHCAPIFGGSIFGAARWGENEGEGKEG